MEKTLQRLLLLGVAYTLGWHLSGWVLFSTSVVVAALTAGLLAFGIIPDTRLKEIQSLPREERFHARQAAFRTAFFYGVLFFYGLALFANLLKGFLAP